MKIHTLSIILDGGSKIDLIFADEQEAQMEIDRLLPVKQRVSDSFGTVVFMPLENAPSRKISALVLQDIDRVGDGSIEVGLVHARTQIKGQERGANDPVLQEAQKKAHARQAFAGAGGFKS